MLQVNLPVVDTIRPYTNKFAMGVKIKATAELNLNLLPQSEAINYHNISKEPWFV